MKKYEKSRHQYQRENICRKKKMINVLYALPPCCLNENEFICGVRLRQTSCANILAFEANYWFRRFWCSQNRHNISLQCVKFIFRSACFPLVVARQVVLHVHHRRRQWLHRLFFFQLSQHTVASISSSLCTYLHHQHGKYMRKPHTNLAAIVYERLDADSRDQAAANKKHTRDTKYGNRNANNCFLLLLENSANKHLWLVFGNMQNPKVLQHKNSYALRNQLLPFGFIIINVYTHACVHIMMNVVYHCWVSNTPCNIRMKWKRTTRCCK